MDQPSQGEHSFHDSQLNVLFEIQQEQQLHDKDKRSKLSIPEISTLLKKQG